MINDTLQAGEPSSNHCNKSEYLCDIISYGLGFYYVIILFIFTISYTCYICNSMRSTSANTPDADDINDHYVSLPQGLEDDVLSTFPTFIYKGQDINNCGSGCSICLADYEAADVIRLLPECGHLFHVSCIDTWLKVHPTCPVCRNSFDFIA